MKIEKNEEKDNEIKVNIGHSEEYADDFYDDGHVNSCHSSNCQCEDCHCDGDECHCDNCSCGCDCENCDCENCSCNNCQCEHCSCHDYDEEMLPDNLIEDFSPLVVERAEKCYAEGKVRNVSKDNNHYYAKVNGHDNNVYDVEVIVHSEYDAEYFCNCPCEYPCKHIYATLLAIADGEYKEVSLKEHVCCNVASLYETISKIPADELKKYLLSDEGIANVCINQEIFNEHFSKYLPNQSYEYYYNNLYNALTIDSNDDELVNDYICDARDYLKNGCYGECFKIIKSIIEAFSDSGVLDVDDRHFELLNKIGMLLRIVYRKDENAKKDIREWTNKLKEVNYYDNYYLEDVILSLN